MLVDTNVLVDVLQSDPDWADWSIAQLQAQSKVHRLAINPIIYSELSLTFSTLEALDQVLDGMELRLLEIPKPALFLAGKAFVQYRRRGGAKTNVLGDFFHWRSCRCQRPAAFDSRHGSVQDLFSERQIACAAVKKERRTPGKLCISHAPAATG